MVITNLLHLFCDSRINPVTGRYEEEKPDPMAGMTEEQKEYEAVKLLNVMDKLQRLVTVFQTLQTSYVRNVDP